MKTINYTGSSKLISRIVNLLNRRAPLPLDGDGDPDWGTNGQVLSTDGSGNTAWVNAGGGGDSVSWTQDVTTGTKIAEIDINGTTTDVYAPSGGSGGHTIEDSSGTAMTQRTGLQFVGATVTDDSANDRTVVTVPTAHTYTEGDGIDINSSDVISVDTTFTEAATRANIASGDTFATILGKIKKFFTDLKTVAFSGAAEDVTYGSGSVKDALDDKVSKSGDTINGDIKIKRSTSANSALELGNADTNSYGLLTLYDGSTGYRANLYANNLSASRSVIFPNKSGTLLVDEDIKIVKAQSGSSNNAVITVPSAYPYATFEIVTPLMLYVGACASTGAISTIKGLDGTTPTVSGNNVTVYVGSYYRTAVLRLYPSAAL